MKRFSYAIRKNRQGDTCVRFDIRHQNHGAKIELMPWEMEELWLTQAEMPMIIATMVDEKIWDAHRKPILEMLAEHYLADRD